jgi:hypothetical protein
MEISEIICANRRGVHTQDDGKHANLPNLQCGGSSNYFEKNENITIVQYKPPKKITIVIFLGVLKFASYGV